MIEERFGPYTVYECIGAGGMATVHRATLDRGDGVTREVALKRLLPQHLDDKTFVDDFLREGQIAARLHHPSIVSILDLGRIGPTYFIAMELIHGQSMMQLIRKAHVAKRPAPIGVVIALISELCNALDYACNGNDTLGERLNIVHRDLSPSNLLVADDGHLRVIDFGVAKGLAGQFATTTGLVKGKLGYMAIEALSGKPLDGRADVFSAGVVAWEFLTGRRLFTGANELEIVQRVRAGVVPPPSSINPACPPTLDGIVQQSLSRSRDERWDTAAAFGNALESVRRAYREESTAAEVMRWRDAIGAEASPRSTRPSLQPLAATSQVPVITLPTAVAPAPAPPSVAPPSTARALAAAARSMTIVEDADEVTVHRPPPRRPMVRAMTELDVLDLEPGLDGGNTAYEGQAYDPHADEHPAHQTAPIGFEPSPEEASRTFSGDLGGGNAFGGPTAPTVPTVPHWPAEHATQLSIDAYPDEPQSAMYDEMSLEAGESPDPDAHDEEPVEHEVSIDMEDPDADATGDHPGDHEEMLDLEGEAPPREELLDLFGDAADDPGRTLSERPKAKASDTLVLGSAGAPRRTRS